MGHLTPDHCECDYARHQHEDVHLIVLAVAVAPIYSDNQKVVAICDSDNLQR